MIDLTSTRLEWDKKKKKETVVRQTQKAPGIYIFEVVVTLQSADKEWKPADGCSFLTDDKTTWNDHLALPAKH